MDYNQFAETIKTKYPAYKNVDNLTLSKKMVEKYPTYATKVKFDAPTPTPVVQDTATSTFHASQNDSPFTAALKTVGNIPGSAYGFVKGAVESLNPITAAKNVAQIATPSTDASKASPLDVIKGIPAAAYHSLIPQALQHLIKGDTQSAQQDITNDPVGQIAPFLLAGEGAAKFADTKLGGLKTAAENNVKNFNTTGRNIMPKEGVYSKAYDTGISKIGQTVTNPITSSISKVGSLTGTVTKSAASHITGLDPSTITQIIQHPEAFSKVAQDQVSRGGLGGEVKTAIDKRLQDLSSTGSAYENLRKAPVGDTPINGAPTGTVSIPNTLVQDTLKKHGIELVDGKVKIGAESTPLSSADVSSLQHFVDTYGNETQLSNNAFLNTRGALSNLSKYDAGKTANIQRVARDLRSAYDEQGKTQIPGLKELDATYAPEAQFLKQVKKDYLNADGTFKDGAVNKIANSTGVGKENLLNRLENVVPGISKRVQILKAVEDIERAKGIKVGTYGKAAASGAAFVAGGLPAAIVTAIVTNPSVAVPLIRGLGYTAAQLAPILSTLRTIGGDINHLRVPDQVQGYIKNPKMGGSVEDVSHLSNIAKTIDVTDKNIMTAFVDGVRMNKLTPSVMESARKLAIDMDLKSKADTKAGIAEAFTTILDLERAGVKNTIANTGKVASIDTMKAIPKELVEEARKYKSAEEVQKIQGDTGIGIKKSDKFEEKQISISKIKNKDTLDSHGGIETDDGSQIYDLMKAYRKGEKIPNIVIDENGKIMDGNHRLVALRELGRDIIDVYQRVSPDIYNKAIGKVKSTVNTTAPSKVK